MFVGWKWHNHHESLKVAKTRFALIFNNLVSGDTIKTNLETNLKFLDGLGDGWMMVKTILQANDNLKKINLIQRCGELRIQIALLLHNNKRLGGPLTLIPSNPNTPMVPLLNVKNQMIIEANEGYQMDDYEDDKAFKQEYFMLVRKFQKKSFGGHKQRRSS